MDAASSCPTTSHRHGRRAPRSRDAARGFVLDGFPRTVAQAEALDAHARGAGATISRVLVIEVAEDELVRRLAGRRVCRAGSHAYHVGRPAAVAGVCDIDGSELYQRDDDREDVVRTRLGRASSADTMPVLDYYRALAPSSTHRRRPRARGRSRPISRAAVRRPGGARDPAQVAPRARDDGRAPARSSRDTLALLREPRGPGVTTASSTHRRGVHPRPAAACRRSRATTASRPRSASRRTTWSCTASPGPYVLREGDVLSVDVGVTLRRLGGRLGLHLSVGEASAEGRSGCSTACRASLSSRHRAVRRRRPPRRHLGHAVQTRVEARRLRRRPRARRPRRGAAHARGPADPELRRRRAAGPSCGRAWCSRSSR